MTRNNTPRRSSSVEGQPLRILVVDDDPAEFTLVEQGFLSCGILFSLLTATTAPLALAEIGMAEREGFPQVALVDINMPLVSGFELAAHLIDQHVPTILMSTQVDIWRVERAREIGALRLLVKPSDLDGYGAFAATILHLLPPLMGAG